MKVRYINLACILAVLFLAVYANRAVNKERVVKQMIVTSNSFQNKASIPDQFTGSGQDYSPHIAWSSIPEGTKSFVLISDDPDAPGGTWVHWVLFNIPPTVTEIPEKGSVGVQGSNSWNKKGYGGPYPPRGEKHRYFFTIYALDATLNLGQGATAAELMSAMKGHILARGELMGYYGPRPEKQKK